MEGKVLDLIRLRKGLSVGYSNSVLEISEDIDLGRGVHFLLGKNGHGKTTLLKSLAGLLSPVSGEITTPQNKLYISEDLHFHDDLPAQVILKSLLGKNILPLALEVAKDIELDVKKPYGKLSTGNKRKVLILLSEFQLHGQQDAVIMMDEPLSGLDREVRNYVHQRWENNESQQARVISYHPDNDDICLDSVLLISNGKLEHIQGEDLCWNDLKAKVA